MIEKGFLVLIIVFYSIAQPSTAQNMALEMVKEKMGIYHVNFPQEKVYIHHDKPQYVLGEQIWFKAYLLSAILHDPITPYCKWRWKWRFFHRSELGNWYISDKGLYKLSEKF
jgi:hypothetical protein